MITAEAIINAKKQHKSLGIALTTHRYPRTRTIQWFSSTPMVMLSAIRHFAKITLFMACTPPEAQLSTCLGVVTVKDELRTLWRSQNIADARAQHRHTTFVRTSARSAEAFRGVCTRRKVSQPPRSVLRPYRSVTHGKLAYDERVRLVFLWI